MARMADQFDLIYPREPEDDTTHVVSLWNIPGGYDYSNARVLCQCFPNEVLAKEFEKRWDQVPEMAVMMTVEEYLEIKKKSAEHAVRYNAMMQEAEETAAAYRASDARWEEEMRLQRAEGY